MNSDHVPATLEFRDGRLYLLDQRQLPHKVDYLRIDNIEEAWQAINTLAVRGAPAIGVAAAYALAQTMLDERPDDFINALERHGEYLKSARPTAVNLAWAVDQLVSIGTLHGDPTALLERARAIHEEDIDICRAIGRNGSHLIESGSNLLTHCNAGSLAVAALGTATAPMYAAHHDGVRFHVYVDETRPLYQGARLTAWELDRAGIDTTLICDNMAATLMAANRVDLVIVGTDRVAANGDVVNKIGTLNVAVLCHHFDVPFYVACPSSTFDAQTPTGEAVVIEQRAAEEIVQDHAANVATFNPAFDVTPADLVTGIITEHGIAAARDISAHMSEA